MSSELKLYVGRGQQHCTKIPDQDLVREVCDFIFNNNRKDRFRRFGYRILSLHNNTCTPYNMYNSLQNIFPPSTSSSFWSIFPVVRQCPSALHLDPQFCTYVYMSSCSKCYIRCRSQEVTNNYECMHIICFYFFQPPLFLKITPK